MSSFKKKNKNVDLNGIQDLVKKESFTVESLASGSITYESVCSYSVLVIAAPFTHLKPLTTDEILP